MQDFSAQGRMDTSGAFFENFFCSGVERKFPKAVRIRPRVQRPVTFERYRLLHGAQGAGSVRLFLRLPEGALKRPLV
jgi:hypothetical protein